MNDRDDTTPTDGSAPGRPRLSDWLWRRWYAKLWWVAIAIWWGGMAVSIKAPPLSTFYASALAGYLNLVLYPMTALIVLGFGYARTRLVALAAQDGDANGQPCNSVDLDPFDGALAHRRFGQPHPSLDIYDPRSGTLYIGNSLSPNNGGRINAS